MLDRLSVMDTMYIMKVGGNHEEVSSNSNSNHVL